MRKNCFIDTWIFWKTCQPFLFHLIWETVDNLKALWRNWDMQSKRITTGENISKFPDDVMRWVPYYIAQAHKVMIYRSKDLLEALEQHLTVKEHLQECKSQQRRQQTPMTVLMHTAQTTQNQQWGQKDHKDKVRVRAENCYFCEAMAHSSLECQKYENLAFRKDRMMTTERCFRCSG